VSNQAIVARKEVAFIAVGEAALGGVGRWIAILGAVLATGSAINATLFSAARLVRDASASGDVPGLLGRESRGLPVVALVFVSAVGTALAMLPGITVVIVFGSAAFLAVYTLVNSLQAAMAERRRDRVLAATGAIACAAAICALVVELARDDLPSLFILLGTTAFVTLARVVFVHRRRMQAVRTGSGA
jgi:amino acid transporter